MPRQYRWRKFRLANRGYSKLCNQNSPVVFVGLEIILMIMRRSGKICMWALAILTLYRAAEAKVADSSPKQFQNIEQRNLFDLKPADPAPAVQPVPVTLPKLTLNGVTDILGRKLAI